MSAESDWGVVQSEIKPQPTEMTQEELVDQLVTKFTVELNKAHREKYDMQEAELTAALALLAQKELCEFLAEAELLAKERKAEVESLEGEKYFYYKENYTGDKKPTDAYLQNMVSKDKEIKAAKTAQYKAEADYNKWRNLFSVLKDGHLFFRAAMKGKNEF